MRFRAETGFCELVTAPLGGGHFEAVRERTALVHDRPQVGPSALAHSIIECHPHEHKPGTACAECPHFLNALPAADGSSVTVRCLFLESDPVELVMTQAALFRCVGTHETVDSARQLLSLGGVRQLVVTHADEVVGIVDAGLLRNRPRHRRLDSYPTPPLPVMPRTLPLGAAAWALVASGRHCVLVVDCDRVVGLVTRGDLSRAGVPGL